MVDIVLSLMDAITLLGFSVGLMWGESFSEFDGKIKYESEWYKRLDGFWQWVVSSLLDATHHYQYGLGLIVLTLTQEWFQVRPMWALLCRWLAWGLIVSDWKDYQNVLKRFQGWKKPPAEIV